MATSIESDVLIVGAGPVGMITSYAFAQRGQSSTLIEKNLATTKYPKMDLTNSRSMEIFRRLGLVDELRALAIPGNNRLDENITSGFAEPAELITTWKYDSPDESRVKWAASNDGSHGRETYIRISQIIVEAWMRTKCEGHPLIDAHWGYQFRSLEENDTGVVSKITDSTGKEITIKSKYVVACDGAWSHARASVGIPVFGHIVPMKQYTVHFKSRDLTRIHKQGPFWHSLFLSGGGLISQDEIDTWTVHHVIPANLDVKTLDPHETIYTVLGGCGGRYEIKIDEILLTSSWGTQFAVAEKFRSEKGRVFLAGDAAHQHSPIGGYGLNSGITDAYTISWILTSAIQGYSGPHLLSAYTEERRPVSLLNTAIAAKYLRELVMPIFSSAHIYGAEALMAKDDAGEALRAKIRTLADNGDWLNRQYGVEMDYRYPKSPVVVSDDTATEPVWEHLVYTPSTYPGSRAPHVFLKDGKTSIFDLYGPDLTIVDFSPSGQTATLFKAAADKLGIPVAKVHIPDEAHVRKIWERDAVLVRPDGHVAWRLAAGETAVDEGVVEKVLAIAVGREVSPSFVPIPTGHEGEEGDFIDVKIAAEVFRSGPLGSMT